MTAVLLSKRLKIHVLTPRLVNVIACLHGLCVHVLWKLPVINECMYIIIHAQRMLILLYSFVHLLAIFTSEGKDLAYKFITLSG